MAGAGGQLDVSAVVAAVEVDRKLLHVVAATYFAARPSRILSALLAKNKTPAVVQHTHTMFHHLLMLPDFVSSFGPHANCRRSRNSAGFGVSERRKHFCPGAPQSAGGEGDTAAST
eukprot:254738-Rhodomonas_salina.1